MFQAIRSWNGPGGYAGIIAVWAIILWAISGFVARFAVWTWNATFGRAAIGLTIAGAISAYLAITYLGHDFTSWTFIGFGFAAAIVLTFTVAACVASLRERFVRDRATPGPTDARD